MKAKVLVDGHLAGTLEKKEKGYSFSYLPNYQGLPVSLTMPIQSSPYEWENFPPFFDGLLPEGFMLEALLRRAKLDRDDYMGQLIKVGQDMVGNVTVEAEG